jgi:hypothetical protein
VTVYLAVMDETQNNNGDFTLGGFVGPELDWKKDFEPAWDERVLGGKIRIPYFHMTDIRSSSWRTEHGITGLEAEARTDEAVRVIRSMGSIYPITAGMKVAGFKSIFADPIIKLGGGKWGITQDPDYLCFVAFAVLALDHADRMLPDATRIDFLIEESQKTTKGIKAFRAPLEEAISKFPELLKLFGSVDAADKHDPKGIPLQAADVLLWYVQRKEAENLDGIDERRFWKLVKRKGYRHHTDSGFLGELSAHLQDGMRKRGMTGKTKKKKLSLIACRTRRGSIP